MCELCLPPLSRRTLLKLGGFSALGLAATGWRSETALAAADDAIEVAPGLRIRPRSAWAGSDLSPGALVEESDVRFLLVHHTASATKYSQEDVVGTLRQIFRHHTGPEKRWPDVCYNFFVDRFGTIWEARQGSIAGPVKADATGGSQGYAQLACLVGDFTFTMPTDDAIESLTKLLAWLADRHGLGTEQGSTSTFVSRGSNRWPSGTEVTTATISGHRDMSSTACPGDTFYPYVRDELPGAVSALRTMQSPATSTVSVQPEEPTGPSVDPSDAPSQPSATEAPISSAEALVPAVEPPAVEVANEIAEPHSQLEGFGFPIVTAAVGVGVGVAATIGYQRLSNHRTIDPTAPDQPTGGGG